MQKHGDTRIAVCVLRRTPSGDDAGVRPQPALSGPDECAAAALPWRRVQGTTRGPGYITSRSAPSGVLTRAAADGAVKACASRWMINLSTQASAMNYLPRRSFDGAGSHGAGGDERIRPHECGKFHECGSISPPQIAAWALTFSRYNLRPFCVGEHSAADVTARHSLPVAGMRANRELDVFPSLVRRVGLYEAFPRHCCVYML